MTTIFNSLMHGVIAGGTTSYLQDRLEEERESRSPNARTTSALQLNHLLLLTAETLCSANIALGAFGLLARTVYILTPLIFLVGLSPNQISHSEAEFLEKFKDLYYMGVAVNLVATCALGNPVFAIASLSMIALNAYASGEIARVFAPAKKVLAICAFIGYGAQVFASEGLLAGLAKVSTFVMGFKLFVLDSKYLNDKFQTFIERMSPMLPGRVKPSFAQQLASKVGNVVWGIKRWTIDYPYDAFRSFFRPKRYVIRTPSHSFFLNPFERPLVQQQVTQNVYNNTYYPPVQQPSNTVVYTPPPAPFVNSPCEQAQGTQAKNGLATALVRQGAWS